MMRSDVSPVVLHHSTDLFAVDEIIEQAETEEEIARAVLTDRADRLYDVAGAEAFDPPPINLELARELCTDFLDIIGHLERLAMKASKTSAVPKRRSAR